MTFLQLLLQILTQISSFLNISISTVSSQAGDCHLLISWHLSWDIEECKQLFPPTPSSSARCSLLPCPGGRVCHHQSWWQMVNLWCMEFTPSKTEGSLRGFVGCTPQKGAGRCPSDLISTSDDFIRFPLSACTPELICVELQSPFPHLLSTSLFWLPSLFLSPAERGSLLHAENCLAPALCLQLQTCHHTDHATISSLLNCLTSQLWLTGEGIEGRNGTQTVKMIIRKQRIHREHHSYLRPLEI